MVTLRVIQDLNIEHQIIFHVVIGMYINSILAHNKLSLLSAYNTLHKFDVICISETYLDKSADNDALSIDGYNIIRADHPHNQKRGGVCIYFK